MRDLRSRLFPVDMSDFVQNLCISAASCISGPCLLSMHMSFPSRPWFGGVRGPNTGTESMDRIQASCARIDTSGEAEKYSVRTFIE